MTTSPNTKVVLITGATTGIGRACAVRFAEDGASLILTGSDTQRVAELSAAFGDRATVVQADAASLEAARSLAATIKDKHGHLDGLVLNAGIAKIAPLAAVDLVHYESQMDTNVRGVIFTLQACLPLLRRGSSVVVITSVAVASGSPGLGVYAATKGAASAFARTMAVELAPMGIRVNCLAPAPIHTSIQGKFGLPADVLTQVASDFTGKIPLGRFGEAREVAAAAHFLLSEDSSFLTGAEIPVDGGYLAA